MIKQKFLSVILTCITFLFIVAAQRLISNETSSNAAYSYSNAEYSYSTEAPTIQPSMPSAFIMLTEPQEQLFVGDSFKISYYADHYKDITWESSNANIAEVDNEGKVTLRGAGEVTIIATVSSKYFYSETKADSVTFTVTSLEPGEPDSTNFSYEVLYDGTIKLNDYMGSSNNIYIPDDINGIPVKDMDIFSNKAYIVQISIAGSLYAVPKDAFSKLSNLRFVEIRDGVKAVNSGTFSFCPALETVTIPDSVVLIADDAFSSDFQGTIEYFSKDSEAYKYAVAHGFKTMRHIEKYGALSYFYENDDEYIKIVDCDETAETAAIPSEINGKPILEIGERAFFDCFALTEITVPFNVKSIGDSAFSECYALDKITIENPDCEIFDSRYTIYNIKDDNGKAFFNGTIYGYDNSTAQAYAEKYSRRFVSLGAAPKGNIIYGDANCDGKVTIADSTAILQHLGNEDKYGLSAQGKENADVDGRAGVTTEDALTIQMIDAKLLSISDLPLKTS